MNNISVINEIKNQQQEISKELNRVLSIVNSKYEKMKKGDTLNWGDVGDLDRILSALKEI